MRGRVEVVAQEAESTAGETDGEPSDEELPVLRRDHEDRTSCDRRNSRRQTVHVVEEIERVRDSHDPHDGHEHVGEPRTKQLYTGADLPQHQAGGDLHDEAHRGAQALQVVEQADDREQERETEHREELCQRPETGGRTTAAMMTVTAKEPTIASPPRYGTGSACPLWPPG